MSATTTPPKRRPKVVLPPIPRFVRRDNATRAAQSLLGLGWLGEVPHVFVADNGAVLDLSGWTTMKVGRFLTPHARVLRSAVDILWTSYATPKGIFEFRLIVVGEVEADVAKEVAA